MKDGSEALRVLEVPRLTERILGSSASMSVRVEYTLLVEVVPAQIWKVGAHPELEIGLVDY